MELLSSYLQSLAIPTWVGEGPLGVVVVGIAGVVVDETTGGAVAEAAAEDFEEALAVGSGSSQRRQ
jgi:hypothetical protein